MKSVLLPFLMGLATVTGCVQNDLDLSILHFVPDIAPTCTVTASDTTVQTSGFFDVGIVAASGSPGYQLFPVVQNDLPLSTDTTTDVEHNAMNVTGVNVQLIPDASIAGAIPLAQLKFFVSAGVGRVDPQSQAVFGVEVIPRAVALELASVVQEGAGNGAPIVRVNVSPVGTRSGSNLVGIAVQFPVSICKFCLSGHPANCPSGGIPTADVQEGGCFAAQDQSVTCCLASQQQLLCGAQVPQPAM